MPVSPLEARRGSGVQSSLVTSNPIDRRGFLRVVGGAAACAWFAPGQWGLAEGRRPRVAALLTSFTFRSHAHVVLENFLEEYYFNGKLTDPGVDVVSFFSDQDQDADMLVNASRKYKIPIFKTIADALTLGGDELAVDAVLSIGEHGHYGNNELGQTMYPRKRFFDEAVAVMKKSKRFVPIFNDKHLSYRWDWSKEMYDTAKELSIPFMAGSSVPLAVRRPALELPDGAQIEEAVSIHGGGVESYDFHALEVLQSIVEFRKGGETGVSEVVFLDEKSLWKAADDGLWSQELADAAIRSEFGDKPVDLRNFPDEGRSGPTHGLLVRYKDGFKAVIIAVGRSSVRWNFACRIKNDPKIHSTSYYVGPWENRNLFKALSHAIQHLFIHRKSPYPVERTLLVSGILDAAMHSRSEKRAKRTPELEFGYEPIDFRVMREMGASWRIITEAIPEPPGIDPNAGL